MQKKIIIFGAGYHGRNALRVCARNKKYKVIYFVDNNSKIHGRKILNTKILSPAKLKSINFDKIIVCGRFIPSIVFQLNNLNINKSKLLLWGKKEIKLQKRELNLRSKDCVKSLKEIMQIFNLYQLKFWIDLGSLLALIRKQDLAESSDIDLVMNYNDLDKIKKICDLKKKKNKKFIVKKENSYYSKLLKKKIPKYVLIKKTNNTNYEPATFELNIFVKKNNNFENLAKKKLFTKNIWSKTHYVRYKKLYLPVTYCSNTYLSKLYGKDWKIKKNFFNKL